MMIISAALLNSRSFLSSNDFVHPLRCTATSFAAKRLSEKVVLGNEDAVKGTIRFQKDVIDEKWEQALREDHLGTSIFQLKKAKKNRRRRKPLTWEDKFALLREFKKVFGHTEVPAGYVVNGVKLGGWVDAQRKEFLKHRFGSFSLIMNERRIKRLDQVGFEWNRQGAVNHQDVLSILKTVLAAKASAIPH